MDGSRDRDRDRIDRIAKTLTLPPRETVRPTSVGGTSADEQAVAALTELEGDGSALEVLGTLGEGGMGIVHLGRQVTMDREVAIKELAPKRRGDASSALKLLQEAWVAGSLEHPNIVPIHDIDVDDKAAPRIVMKRIQGWSWDELITDAEAVAEHFAETDLLEWNLGILMQVADAVRYAHSRGIVHLDLKPQNVMIGEFGEVALVDWGLGMSLREGAGGRFPLAADNQDIIGTPSYLAPEMLSGDGSALSERTDVYLLGSVLFHILTGEPPHRGPSMAALLYGVVFGERELPESLPSEIREICLRAMATEPSERYESARAFRIAVRQFLQHRGAIRLSREAERQLEALKAITTTGPQDDVRGHWDELNRAFSEARFGFRQALAAWPGHETARQGLRETLLVTVEHVLVHGTATTASALYSEIEDPPVELGERVQGALDAQAAEGDRVRKLERVAKEVDFSIGERSRLVVLGILGVLWILHPLVIVHSGPRSVGELLRTPAIFLGITGLLGWLARENLRRTLVNRRLFSAVIAMFAAHLVLVTITATLGITAVAHAPLMFFLWTMTAVFVTLMAESRLWPTALAQGIGLVVTLVEPAWFSVLIASANAVFVANIAVIWRPGKTG